MRTTVSLILFVWSASAFGADVEGSSDHPLISRYPGSEIRWQLVENYRSYKLPVGPITGYRTIDDWIETEGRVTRTYYELDGGDRTHSEVYANYKKALEDADFEMLAQGLFPDSSRSAEVGSRAWQEILFRANSFPAGAVNTMAAGSATSGGSGSIMAKKELAEGPVYVAISVYQYSADTVSTLVDVIEVEQVETGLVAVDLEALRQGIEEEGRVILDGIFFDFDKATLKPESKEALDNIASYLEEHADKQFYVVGHTDSKGSFTYNRDLSKSRAQVVVEALATEYGIGAERLEGHGVGPLVPVFANTSEAGRERNRRVELVER